MGENKLRRLKSAVSKLVEEAQNMIGVSEKIYLEKRYDEVPAVENDLKKLKKRTEKLLDQFDDYNDSSANSACQIM